MAIYEFNNKGPTIGEGTWVAPSAEIIGNVRIGKHCWIGPGAIIRGDFGTIIIADETAVEDGVIIHCVDMVQIGKRVTIGHGAIIHNTTIKDFAVIGMNSTISDNSVVGMWSIIAEHSLVKKDQAIPDYKIYGGSPASYKADLEQRHKEYMMWGQQLYVDLTAQYINSLRRIDEQVR
ncbi:MAG: gamma carbonic anhydrase family protein [Deltaproteobacteria bacterium]|nr:gamma carbonic anhydrase family protein [Deltaproteobacteria bacterium]